MAGRKLRTFVHVDGVAYGPEDEVPAEVAERITAPGVWEDEADPADEAKTAARRKPAAKSDEK
jgi:hypothetical protein